MMMKQMIKLLMTLLLLCWGRSGYTQETFEMLGNKLPDSVSAVPLLSTLKGKVPEIMGHTMVSRFIPGIPGGMDMIPASDSSSRKISVRNVQLTWHYNTAYGAGKQFFSSSEMSLEVKELDKLIFFKPNDYDTWIRDNGYCYELQLPRSMDSLIYIRMQEDLRKFFPQYEAFVEKRNLKVLALTRTSNIDRIATKGGKATYAFSGVHAMMRNVTLSLLPAQLGLIYLQNSTMPIINEAGYKVKVDLDLNADLSDINSINRELKKFDLQFIEKEKLVDVLVIRDRI